MARALRALLRPAAPPRRRHQSSITSCVAWGDTSTWWDWSARCLTLSAEAAGLPMKHCPNFREVWDRENSFVTRVHGVAFATPHDAVHMRVPAVSVAPRLARVSRRSFGWRCDLRDAASDELLATTHGTFVHVDTETYARAVEMSDAMLAELRPLATGEDRADAPEFPDDAWAPVDWTTVVRGSDADDFGHVNNAKWAYLAADALRAAGDRGPPASVDVAYLRPAVPGDALAATMAESDCGAARVALEVGGATAVAVDFTF